MADIRTLAAASTHDDSSFQQALLNRMDALVTMIERAVPATLAAPDFDAAVAWVYRRRPHAFGASVGVLEAVTHPAQVRMSDLKDIDAQKERVLQNTQQFLQGRPANHVLLTGARGTGKSSLVKALLNEFSQAGLRLIEMDRADLIHLPDVVPLLRGRPERYIIFSDDLSFDEGDGSYKALKSVLDGSVASGADNMLIYATSNRRHLLPEYQRDNESYQHTADGEIHPGEAVEEKISLSERFGLWLSFYPFSQEEYLHIAAHWLAYYGVPFNDEAKHEARVFALERGSRSGRVAQQFARDYAGRNAHAAPGKRK
jgi:hypothetical protein